MATGFEDYIIHMYTQPSLALERCQQHLVALMGMQGPMVGADWSTYNPQSIDAAIAQVRKDLAYLQGVVYGIGAPRAIMTRRVDPGPTVGLGSTG